MWSIFKVFIDFVIILLLLFMFRSVGHEACGISVPQPVIKPAPPALEGNVLTTGPPGKSLHLFSHTVLCLFLSLSHCLQKHYTLAISAKKEIRRLLPPNLKVL